MAIVGEPIECSQGSNDEMPVLILVKGTRIGRTYEGVFGCGSGHLSKFQLSPSENVEDDICISKDKAASDIARFKKKHIKTIQKLPFIAKDLFSKFQNAYTINETSNAAISLRLLIERFVHDNYCHELGKCGNSVFNLTSVSLILSEIQYKDMESNIQKEMDNKTSRGRPSYEEQTYNYRCASDFHNSIIQKERDSNLLSPQMYGQIKMVYQKCSTALHHISSTGNGSTKLLETADIMSLWDEFLSVMSAFYSKNLLWDDDI